MKIPPLLQAMLWMAAAQGSVCARDRLTVVVFNYAGVPDSIISNAVENARLMFRAAGVESTWPVCDTVQGWPENCTKPLPPDGVYLELFVTPRRIALPPGRSQETNPAGYALIGALIRPRAYVFYNITQIAAATAVRPVPLVLSCVLVHEAAHLLGLEHQSQGVMRSHLDARDMDFAAMGRAFNSEEGKQLRARVASSHTLAASR